MRHGQVTWQEYGMVNDGNAKKMGLSPVILLTAIPKYGYIYKPTLDNGKNVKYCKNMSFSSRNG